LLRFARGMRFREMLKPIPEKLKYEFLDREASKSYLSIFLCGGASSKSNALRKRLGSRIEKMETTPYRYSVHYPEEMFEELVLGTISHNYLSLENILADSANVVVILLGSPGTFTELGAFANKDELCDKLIVLVEKKFQSAKSFIVKGALRHLEKNTKSIVEYVNFDDLLSAQSIYRITDLCRQVNLNSQVKLSLSNPIRARELILAIIRTFEPVPRRAIVYLTRLLDDTQEAEVSVLVIINMLLYVGWVRLVGGNLVTTPAGKASLVDPLLNRETEIKRRRELLARCRCEALDFTLRKCKPEEFWRGV
jgi:hypothetical protein